MPITPLHMGPALLGKAALDNRISLIAFGICQILIDMEPLLGLILHWPQLHGVTHTLPLALAIISPGSFPDRRCGETSGTSLNARCSR